ncbi:HK97 family phage prohead protease [Sphingomonas sp.]|uniref:HK97 family phage prohead protease n=1 Tax=Sphingomonas sp. TaxID=28214 RepID=UPI003B3A7C34
MLKKEFGLSVKDVSDEGIIEGYGSTFGGAPDSYGDIIMPGAFAASLAKHRREGTMPLMLWGHQSGELPVGDWVDIAEDGKGLWMKGQLDLADPVGLRVHRALKRKSVRGLSIGYETLERDTDAKRPGVSFLKQIDLWEVSLVNFPANRRSLITAVKANLEAGTLPSVREFEEFLRDAGGFSKTLAAAIAGKATPHLRGEPEAQANDAVRFLEKLRG